MTAAKSKVESDIVEGADPTESPAGWEWETVVEGSATTVIFENIGDSFVGQYIGDEHIEREPSANGEDQSFDRFLYRGRDGERYAINKSYALSEGMTKVQPNQWCKITYIKDIPTARKLNDMKDFKIDVRK